MLLCPTGHSDSRTVLALALALYAALGLWPGLPEPISSSGKCEDNSTYLTGSPEDSVSYYGHPCSPPTPPAHSLPPLNLITNPVSPAPTGSSPSFLQMRRLKEGQGLPQRPTEEKPLPPAARGSVLAAFTPPKPHHQPESCPLVPQCVSRPPGQPISRGSPCFPHPPASATTSFLFCFYQFGLCFRFHM